MVVNSDRISKDIDPEEAPDEAMKAKTMKSMFLEPSNIVHGMAKFEV